jgi:hypothetical protein
MCSDAVGEVRKSRMSPFSFVFCGPVALVPAGQGFRWQKNIRVFVGLLLKSALMVW